MTPRSDLPTRTCVGCRQRGTKRELLRVVRGTDAAGQPAVAPDPDGVAPGRGASLHPTLECLALAVRRKAFGRALRVEGSLSLALLTEHLEQRAAPHTDLFDQELEH